MRRNLLDTNVALLATLAPERLSTELNTALLEGENFLSIVFFWEIMLKSMKGKLDVGDPDKWWSDTLEQLNASPVSLTAKDISALTLLDPIHQDPFDRIMVASAINHGLRILTTDSVIKRYASGRLIVIS